MNLAGADGVLGFADSIGTGLTANYYTNETFSGTPQTRLVTSIGFDAGNGAPLAGIPADNFSIRWDGYLYIPTAAHIHSMRMPMMVCVCTWAMWVKLSRRHDDRSMELCQLRAADGHEDVCFIGLGPDPYRLP